MLPFDKKLSFGQQLTCRKMEPSCTDKKENQIFLIYKEIESGAAAKS
jgi:hypothetical protein